MSLAHNRIEASSASSKQTPALYHYTYRHEAWLGSIIHMGVILPVSPTQPVDRRVEPCPAVWFSRRDDFEPTALKSDMRGRTTTPEDFRRIGARIVVPAEVAPTSWAVFRRTAAARFHLSRKAVEREAVIRQRMEQFGRSVGADPADWFCTYEPIPDTLWIDIQVCDEAGQWASVASRQ